MASMAAGLTADPFPVENTATGSAYGLLRLVSSPDLVPIEGLYQAVVLICTQRPVQS